MARRLLLVVCTMWAVMPLLPLPSASAGTGPYTVTVDVPGGTHVYGETVEATVHVVDSSGAAAPGFEVMIDADNGWCNSQPTGTTDATGTVKLGVALYCRQNLVATATSTGDSVFEQRSDNTVHEEVSLPLTLSVPTAKRPFWAVPARVGGTDVGDLYLDQRLFVIQTEMASGWQNLTALPISAPDGYSPWVWAATAGTHQLRLVYQGDDRSDGFALSTSPSSDFVVGTGTVPTWLRQLNHYRHLAHLAPLGEDPAKDAADRQHIRYMAKTGQYVHTEDSNNPNFTRLGNQGGENSDLYKGIACDKAIAGWLVTPYHGEPMLSQTSYTTGFSCAQGYAALYVYDYAQSVAAPSYPQTWPVDGGLMPLRYFGGGENPDPLQHCPAAWTRRRDRNVGMGAALQAFTPTSFTHLHAQLSDNGAATKVCAFRDYHTVHLLPLLPLRRGHQYTVRLTSDRASLSWSFRA